MSDLKKFNIKVNGQNYDVEVQEVPLEEKARKKAPVIVPNRQFNQNSTGSVTSPMPGVIAALKVAIGDQVTAEQAVVTLEAMKMENEIPAGKAGQVKEIFVKPGQSVSAGELLVIIE